METAPGRIRLGKIENFSAASLHGFVAANVAQGATIKTDGWAAYPGAPGVDHDPHVVGAMAAHVVLPWTHRVQVEAEPFDGSNCPAFRHTINIVSCMTSSAIVASLPDLNR